ncbi:MAG: rubrerythrin family protein [Candidatus Schekmanbacteria bacterium]|nr:MAG: rubrerythrin family protein [Candidatus Schekmanbacteria bacterium]
MSKTDENLEKNFKGETSEVGLYLAMSKQAEIEGYPDIAMYLRQVAMDEAWHAAWVAKIQGKIGTTKENLEKMLSGESGATVGKAEAAKIAREEGNEEAARFFEIASRDEDRHRAGLEGFLKKL